MTPFFRLRNSAFLKFALLAYIMLHVTGCTTSILVSGSLESRPIDSEHFETQKAYISRDNKLTIYYQGGIGGDNTSKTITVDLNKFSEKNNVDRIGYHGNVYALPRSVINKWFKSWGSQIEIPIVDVTICEVFNKESPIRWFNRKRETNARATEYSNQVDHVTNPYDVVRSHLTVEEGHKGTLYVIHYTRETIINPYETPTGGWEWVYVSDELLDSKNKYISFQVKRKNSRPRLEYLLLTPLTVAIDAITFPIQIVMFEKWKTR